MRPSLSQRWWRLLCHDTSLARMVTSAGLTMLGGAMVLGLGAGKPGYTLLEDAWPIQFWGLLYVGVGAWGLYGVVNRLSYWVRIGHTMGGMYLWAFIAIAQFTDQPLPTRLLLLLPAFVDVWVLVKTVLAGPRMEKI